MAAPPNNFAGDHAFIADGTTATAVDSAADSHALILRMLHLLNLKGDDVILPAARAQFDEIAAAARQGLAAAKASAGREQNTRQLRSITSVPDAQYGAGVNVGAVRLNASLVFDAGTSDPAKVFDWLTRILDLAQLHTLTFEATKSLLIQASGGPVTGFIRRLRDEGRSLAQIVQQLEMRFGNLCSPEEARARCTVLARKEGEELSKFLDRLGLLAQMAASHLPTANERSAYKDSIIENNIRRVLPVSVRNILEERIVARLRTGLRPFTVPELEQECLELERRRAERKSEIAGSRKGSRRVQAVQAADYHVQAVMGDDSTPDVSSEEEPAGPDEDEEAIYVVKQAAEYKRKFEARGKSYPQAKLLRAAIGKWNEKRRPHGPGRYQGARQAAQGAQGGPPDELHHRPSIYELLTMAKVDKGCCVQCGQKGHMMGRDECALKGKTLKTVPCAKCGQGLHSADDCVRAFQQQANQAGEYVDLNEQ